MFLLLLASSSGFLNGTADDDAHTKKNGGVSRRRNPEDLSLAMTGISTGTVLINSFSAEPVERPRTPLNFFEKKFN
jgi:hypothetical protein